MSAALIFGLLFALMLTGMPISISLGLTVLTFLFTMTQVPIESVGLKLFSGLDNFGIMAIPFFILAGTFLTRGGVARRMIAFTTSVVGHLPRHHPGADAGGGHLVHRQAQQLSAHAQGQLRRAGGRVPRQRVGIGSD